LIFWRQFLYIKIFETNLNNKNRNIPIRAFFSPRAFPTSSAVEKNIYFLFFSRFLGTQKKIDKSFAWARKNVFSRVIQFSNCHVDIASDWRKWWWKLDFVIVSLHATSHLNAISLRLKSLHPHDYRSLNLFDVRVHIFSRIFNFMFYRRDFPMCAFSRSRRENEIIFPHALSWKTIEKNNFLFLLGKLLRAENVLSLSLSL
jgi:hypothetical protein